jgi:mRNA interferase RelE/StbE
MYRIDFKPRALKDLRAVNVGDRGKILTKIEGLENDLAGDVKRLTNFTPEYRLRIESCLSWRRNG